jgi:hypothetical protein
MATKRKKTAKKPMVTEAKFLKLKTELVVNRAYEQGRSALDMLREVKP